MSRTRERHPHSVATTTVGWAAGVSKGGCTPGAGTRTPFATLFSFLPIFQARTHPRGQRRRFLKAFPPLFFFFFPSPGTEMLRGLWASTVLAGSQNAASAWAPRPGLTLARSESLSPFLESQLSLLVVIFSQCNSLLPNFSVLVPKRKRSLTHLSR